MTIAEIGRLHIPFSANKKDEHKRTPTPSNTHPCTSHTPPTHSTPPREGAAGCPEPSKAPHHHHPPSSQQHFPA